ncbi:DUF2254 domain-containing protein [Rhodococcus sp. 1168]|uniref:DUF2254 domain-containing protein n=1 Tax=Rhodococcus sp. 1168 TaxID=2018041 RepID=UPI000A0D9C0F|nr:DUF2254 domain-containing protein [Rhodococcus sp. 1168]ORI15712.1 hypothetical protein BJI47_04975 [Rhodococcus sp. 1168]
MGTWFTETVVNNGRLPLFFLLVSFLLAFLFIRFSVRMIRAEVSWWPGNVTPGGMHIHHVMFGLVMVLVSGFALVAIANYETPVANCILASVFGIGSALMLDEFALILHLRDVYWAEEGRSSIDAVFVAIAISGLYLLGVHPIGFTGDFDVYQQDRSLVTLALVLFGLALQLGLAAITLLKGKLWTGLIGLFFTPLLIVGAIRLGRPLSPWDRWRYADKPGKRAKAFTREKRFREPVIRAKIFVQEALSGRFGVPIEFAASPVEVAAPDRHAPTKLPNRFLTALRWNRTRRRLRRTPMWRLPMILVSCSIILALVLVDLDSEFADSDSAVGAESAFDIGSTATLLAVIAGGMVTLTGLVFTAITLAMQFGASQISVRVVPMLQQELIMRVSIGMFLSTFVFAVVIASDLALSGETTAPIISTSIAILLALVSAFLFIALVSRVGMVLNSSRLLRWIAAQGRSSIVRTYPGFIEELEQGPRPDFAAAPDLKTPVLKTQPNDHMSEPLGESRTIRLRQLSPDGRILLAVNLSGIERLAEKWGVTIEVMPYVGEFVAQDAVLFEVNGPQLRMRPHQLMACLVFGDTHSPTVSPAAGLTAIVDIALKGLSPAINDPGRAVQAIDHLEDLLMTLAPRVRLEASDSVSTRIRGTVRTWPDYVAIATDEIRHFSAHSAQVYRRLRSLFATLLASCPPDQHPPLLARLDALDAQIAREWTDGLDIALASVADPQGFGSELGSAGRTHPLVLGVPTIETDESAAGEKPGN